jgi:hypothetical protein
VPPTGCHYDQEFNKILPPSSTIFFDILL